MRNIKLLVLVMAMAAVMTNSAVAAEKNPAADRAIGGSYALMSGIVVLDLGYNLAKSGNPYAGVPMVVGGACLAASGNFLALSGIYALGDPEAWPRMMSSACTHAALSTALGTGYFFLGSYLMGSGHDVLGLRIVLSGVIFSIAGGLWAIHAGTFVPKINGRKRDVDVYYVPSTAPSIVVRW